MCNLSAGEDDHEDEYECHGDRYRNQSIERVYTKTMCDNAMKCECQRCLMAHYERSKSIRPKKNPVTGQYLSNRFSK
jgi:hypothetical protein